MEVRFIIYSFFEIKTNIESISCAVLGGGLGDKIHYLHMRLLVDFSSDC